MTHTPIIDVTPTTIRDAVVVIVNTISLFCAGSCRKRGVAEELRIKTSDTSCNQQMRMERRRGSPWLLMLQVFGLILVVVNQADSSTADKTIRIGYLTENVVRGGAISVAIDRIRDEGLLLDFNIRYYYYYITITCTTAVQLLVFSA